MRHLAAAALVATSVAVALCPADRGASVEPAGAAATPADADLHATLQRSRLFETQRSLRVSVWYEGDHDVRLESVQLDTPLFETVTAQTRDPVVHAGGRIVAMPVQFGTARCDAEEAPPRLVVGIDGTEQAIPLGESPVGLLADLHGEECAVAAVREVVDVRFGDDWERVDSKTIEGTVELEQRRPGTTASVEDVLGNVIFDADADARSDPLMAVDDDEPSATIGLTVNASRCDPHALTEYKRTFILVAMVGVGDDEPLRVDIVADEGTPARQAMEELLPACLE